MSGLKGQSDAWWQGGVTRESEKEHPQVIVEGTRDKKCLEERENLKAINDLTLGWGIWSQEGIGQTGQDLKIKVTGDEERWRKGPHGIYSLGTPVSCQPWSSKKPPSQWPISFVKTQKWKTGSRGQESWDQTRGRPSPWAHEMGKVESTELHFEWPGVNYLSLKIRRDTHVGKAQSNYNMEPERRELVSSGARGLRWWRREPLLCHQALLLSDILIKP